VDPAILDTLYSHFAEFRRGYDVEGLTPEEFDTFGATVRTLRGFIAATHDLLGVVREFMLPNPDIK
jgi:transaldolase